MNRRKTTHDGLKMPGWIKAWVYASTATCFASGAVWLALHYFTRHQGPFGPEPHPLEHPVLVVHACIAALLIWCIGLIFVIHIKRGWQKKLNRTTGSVIAVMAFILLLTGLGLYYLGDENLRANAALAHWVVGLAAGVALPAHIYWGRYLTARRSKQDAHR
jgi:O-antigen/teichoic acid export membrane protein